MTDDTQPARPTPPQQTTTDPTAADRRLTPEQKRDSKAEPKPPAPAAGKPDLPDPGSVGEAG
jgi:hypothetical protein